MSEPKIINANLSGAPNLGVLFAAMTVDPRFLRRWSITDESFERITTLGLIRSLHVQGFIRFDAEDVYPTERALTYSVHADNGKGVLGVLEIKVVLRDPPSISELEAQWIAQVGVDV